MTDNLHKSFVRPFDTILTAMQSLSESNCEICLVVDQKQQLLGTVTDGDIRRAILQNLSTDTPTKDILNPSPVTAHLTDSKIYILQKMNSAHIRRIPVVNDSGIVMSLIFLEDLLQPHTKSKNWVFLMAGGFGTRLHPLTKEIPKPLLSIGNKPLLETIICNFLNHNFNRFYISVNYKAKMIQDYFGDGSRWGAEIRYVNEDAPMGTAGSLKLIKEPPSDPMIIMNGDLLTQVNSELLLDFHHQENAYATMCVREYDLQVPFGVVELKDHCIKSIDEKPLRRFFVNAGIYVINPEIIDLIPKNTYYDITTLFEKLIELGHKVPVFPVREYWLDIGRIDDLERARRDFDSVFGS